LSESTPSGIGTELVGQRAVKTSSSNGTRHNTNSTGFSLGSTTVLRGNHGKSISEEFLQIHARVQLADLRS
jgi:hypothetical protein